MKKIIFCLTLICIVLASCKKDNINHTGSSGTNKVTFNVGFSQTIENFGSNALAKSRGRIITGVTTRALSDMVDVIYYGVYDASGKGVHIITQKSTDANFGSYTDELKAGNYTIAIVAGKSGVLLGTANFGAATSTLSTDVISCGIFDNESLSNPWSWNVFDKDAFFQKQTLTVGAAATSLSFSLTRITSEFVLNINDAIPTSAVNITITFTNTSDRFSIGSATAVPYDNTFPSNFIGISNLFGANFKAADHGTTNYQLSSTFLYAAPFTANLEVTGAASTLSVKNITNITAQANKETLLSGNLFGGNGLTSTGGIQPEYDPTWSGTTTITF